LNACHEDFALDNSGEVARYIPELGKANPRHFGIRLATLDGHVYETGDSGAHTCGRRPALLPAEILTGLNPIQQFFAKLKPWLRKAAKRSTDAVFDAIRPILDIVTSAKCANYFANAGCDQT
jgi:Glutaminase